MNETPQKSATSCYRSVWQPSISEETDLAVRRCQPGAILLFDVQTEIHKAFKARHSQERSHNVPIIMAQAGMQFNDKGDYIYEINPEEPADYVRLLRTLREKDMCPVTLVHLWSLEKPVVPLQTFDDIIHHALWRGVYSLYYVIRAFSELRLPFLKDILCVFDDTGDISGCVKEAIGGYGNSLSLLYPELRFSTLQIPPFDGTGKELSELVLRESGIEDSGQCSDIRYEHHTRYQKTIEAVCIESGNALPLRPKGHYLITGGSGALGRIFAEYLAQNYQATLVLTGRSEIDKRKQLFIDKLKRLGSHAVYIQRDVSNQQTMRALIDELKVKYGNLHGVIHAAGIADTTLITRKNFTAFGDTLRSKIFGTVVLDDVTKQEPLDFFLVFSSTSAILGDFGQCDYAIGNRFLDSYARLRESFRTGGLRAGKTITINWPLWREGGMHLNEETEAFYLQTSGMTYLETAEGLRRFEEILKSGYSQIMVLSGDERRQRQFLKIHDVSPQVFKKCQTKKLDLNMPRRKAAMSDSAGLLQARVVTDIKRITAELLHVSAEKIEEEENLGNLGFDSILLKEFSHHLEKLYGVEVPPTVFFNRSTIKGLAGYLGEECEQAVTGYYLSTPHEVQKDRSEQIEVIRQGPFFNPEEPLIPLSYQRQSGRRTDDLQSKPQHAPIAIIGMNGRFPGASNIEEYWQNLVEGKDVITVVPKERWDWHDYFGETGSTLRKTNSKWGGFISDVDAFDARFFDISPQEASMMDPQQRILLEAVWKTLEDAGYRASSLSGRNIGIFIGAESNDYQLLLKNAGELNAHMSIGNHSAVLANRLSFFLNVHGPSEMINTACSSSLVAVHQAVKSLRQGESEIAIAGGVSLILEPSSMISAAQLGILSPDGRCKTFDKKANGYVKGEGVGVILLKPLNRALNDRDFIYAVIKGSAVNHGGRANSLTAPNSDAQAELLVTAYEDASIPPASVSYLEVHGTGTELGDPVEIHGIKRAFYKLAAESESPIVSKPSCGIGSVKTNIGHLEPVSGIAGLIKVVLSMQQKTLPGILHFSELNPYIEIEETPFYIVDKTQPWKKPADKAGNLIARRAGISSFGFGGTNAHVVLEEHEMPAEQTGSSTPDSRLIVLSAKNKDRLREYADSVAGFLNVSASPFTRPAPWSLKNIAYTFQVGREPMPERLALIVSTIEELKTGLSNFFQGKHAQGNCFTGNSRHGQSRREDFFLTRYRDKELIRLFDDRELTQLAQLWVDGLDIDWTMFYRNEHICRLPLPTYPFARTRHHIPKTTASEPDADYKQMSMLHPLIHANISTLQAEKFVMQFKGDEFYLQDHVIRQQQILPGVVYLEMARAAGEIAAEMPVKKIMRIVWMRPFIARQPFQKLYIHVYPRKDSIRYRISSISDREECVHVQGNLVCGQNGNKCLPKEQLDLEGIKARCPHTLSQPTCYERFNSLGLAYGKSFQGIRTLWYNEAEVLSFLELPDSVKQHAHRFVLHPSLTDGALQSIIGLLPLADLTTPLVPFELGEVEIISPLPEQCYAYVTFVENPTRPDSSIFRFHVTIIDEQGHILVTMKNFIARAYRPEHTPLSSSIEHAAYPVMYFTSEWKKNGFRLESSSGFSGSMLVFDTNTTLVEKLNAQGHHQEAPRSILVTPGKSYKEISSQSYEIRPEKQEDYEQLVHSLNRHNLLPRQIVHYWSKNEFSSEPRCLTTQLHQSLYSLFFLAQTLLSLKIKDSVRLLYLYDNQQNTPQPQYAAVSGFLKTLRLEHAKFLWKTVELANQSEMLSPKMLQQEFQTNDGVLEIRYDNSQRFIQCVQPISLKANSSQKLVWKDNGVYIITGGTGSLGLLFAEFLVKMIRARLILVGRSELSEEQQQTIRRLELSGAQILHVRADVSKQADVIRLIAETKRHFDKIDGILHCAGLNRDAYIIQKTAQQVEDVLAAKVYGTIYLDEATQNEDLDFFAMFSSLSAILGNSGQSDYAFSNCFLDQYTLLREQLRHARRRRGKTISINWPLWRHGGMHVDDPTQMMLQQVWGLVPLTSQAGISAFNEIFMSDESHVIVATGDPYKIRQQIETPSNLSKGSTPVFESSTITATTNTFRCDLSEIVTQILNIPIAEIDPDEELSTYGFDSITFTEFANRLNAQYDLELTPAIFFEYPTIRAVVRFLQNAYPAHILKSVFPPAQQTALPLQELAESVNKTRIEPVLHQGILTIVSTLLKVPLTEIDINEALSTYGFDSITFTELANRLNEIYQLEITPAVFFEYPTIAGLAQALYRDYPASFFVDPSATRLDTEVVAPCPAHAKTSRQQDAPDRQSYLRFVSYAGDSGEFADRIAEDYEPIAIIGISGVLPQSDDLHGFWEHLVEKRDLITEIPPDRWDWRAYYGDPQTEANKTFAKWGGFIKDIAAFDAMFFGISPLEAKLMDPQQRIFLETVWHTIEDAGYRVSELAGTKTGMFVGVAAMDYYELLQKHAVTVDAYMSTGNARSVLSNRISHLFDFHGPSEAIDTACSSSLVAIHRAINALHAGDCTLAVAGGVNVLLTPTMFIAFSRAGMLSKDGRCKTFDKRANGYVRGEGAGAVLLKPLRNAVADGDHIYALIRGSAENHGGKAQSLTAPNPNLQVQLIVDAYQKANINPQTVTYIEAHGTGTRLGDPIEINGLNKAFHQLYQQWGIPIEKRHCGLGSVKTNIGHLETAAGIAGVLKILLAMQYRTLPGTVHFEEQNPYIQLTESPFYIVKDTQPWQSVQDSHNIPMPRCAGISSFGFGGSNAHIVFEEYEVSGPSVSSIEPQVIVLSAKRPESLSVYARMVADYVEKHKHLPLNDIAYTMQTGREALEERVAVIVSRHDELIEKLAAFSRDISDVERLYRGRVEQEAKIDLLVDGEEGAAFLNSIIRNNNYRKLAQLWVRGVEIEWSVLHRQIRPRRVSLPTYPFAREQYWFSESSGKPDGAFSSLHPLLDAIDPSRSLKQGVVFSKTFDTAAPILADHQVKNRAVFPAVGYLEMAYAACAQISTGRTLRLYDIVWSNPFVIEAAEEMKTLYIVIREHEGELAYEIKSDGTGKSVTHSRGRIVESPNVPNQSLSIPAIQARCPRRIDRAVLYRAFVKLGIAYGPYFQAVDYIIANEQEALGCLRLPPDVVKTRSTYTLHPTLMDGALQTISGLLWERLDASSMPLLPFSVEKIEILRPLTASAYAYVQRAADNIFHIAMTDDAGSLCVKLHGVGLREAKGSAFRNPEPENRGFFFVPQWVEDPLPDMSFPVAAHTAAATKKIVLIVSAPDSGKLARALAEEHAQDEVIRLSLGEQNRQNSFHEREITADDSAALENSLAAIQQIDVCYFLGGIDINPVNPEAFDDLEKSLERGVLSLFRLVKAFCRHGLAQQSLRMSVITNNTFQVIPGEPISPYAAGLQGLVGVIIREFPRWYVTYVDIHLQDMELQPSGRHFQAMVRAILKEPAHSANVIIALRKGKRYRRSLVSVQLSRPDHTPFKDRGVYLIIGGAGGIGLALSRYLAETVRARLILLGRSALDAEQQAKIAEIETLGGQVSYVQVDVSDRAGMHAAFAQIKSRFEHLNGVIHSALVLHDQRLNTIDEATFRVVLAPKVQGSVILYELIREEPLDFLMFFSSTIAFAGNAGQSNYATACTFKDAFATYIDQQTPYPVTVINWGYWGTIGVVAQEHYRQRLASQGMYSITPQEGMDAIQCALGNKVAQLIAVKANEQALMAFGIDQEHHAVVYAETLPSLVEFLVEHLSANQMTSAFKDDENDTHAWSELEYFMRSLLLKAFQRMGVFTQADKEYDISLLKKELHILPDYYRLCDALLLILRKAGIVTIEHDKLMTTALLKQEHFQQTLARLAERKEQLLGMYPAIGAQVELVWACVPNYPEVLTGKKDHLDVMFPGGSKTLVKNVYKGNSWTDFYNTLVARAITRYVKERLRRDPQTQIRILEVGAGTGGTTDFVVDALRDFSNSLTYWYTDISLSFLHFGEEKYSHCPWMTFKALNIECDPLQQGFVADSFDLIFGANVFHATHNIKQTLGRVKLLLKTHGIVLLNEVTRLLEFATLTFGLTDGWWLFDDKEYRIPGSPLLSSKTWQAMLTKAGYRKPQILSQATLDVPQAFQSVIVAESDGRVLRETTNVDTMPDFFEEAGDEEARAVETDVEHSISEEDLRAKTVEYVKGVFSETLKLKQRDIADQATFDKYGVDSLIVLDITRRLEQDFRKLPSTLLFEYNTVEKLSGYFIAQHYQPLRNLLDKALPGFETRPDRSDVSQSIFARTGHKPTPPERDVHFVKSGDIRDFVYGLSDDNVESLIEWLDHESPQIG